MNEKQQIGIRWKNYVKEINGSNPSAGTTPVQWLWVISSFFIVLFLMALVFVILMRALKRDFTRYNSLDDLEDEPYEEAGWKMVHGDVFRVPDRHPTLLAGLVGSGALIGEMVAATLVMVFLGFHFDTALLCLYATGGGIHGGYVSGKLLRFFFNNKNSGSSCAPSAFLLAGLLMVVAMASDTIIRTLLNGCEDHDGEVNISQCLKGLIGSALTPSLSLVLVATLSFVGIILGQRIPMYEVPVRVTQICRPIPPWPYFADNPWSRARLICGVMPFLASLILKESWQHPGRIDSLAALLVLALVSAEAAMVSVYLLLNRENYRWWWHGFLVPASSGLCFPLMSYLLVPTELMLGTRLIFYLYSCVVGALFGISCGSAGFQGAFWLVGKIYSPLPVD